jgi:hypothetical protein
MDEYIKVYLMKITVFKKRMKEIKIINTGAT